MSNDKDKLLQIMASLESDYAHGTISKEKYIYRAKLYLFDCEISYLSSSLLSVLFKVAKDRTELFSEYHVWDIKTQTLLPPSFALSLICDELKIPRPHAKKKKLRSVGSDGKNIFTQ